MIDCVCADREQSVFAFSNAGIEIPQIEDAFSVCSITSRYFSPPDRRADRSKFRALLRFPVVRCIRRQCVNEPIRRDLFSPMEMALKLDRRGLVSRSIRVEASRHA